MALLGRVSDSRRLAYLTPGRVLPTERYGSISFPF